ncbi:MAG TPA: hypothetical protein DC024_08595 [Clostridiales bacterium]|jgi:hypothetical protein|nr:hypothetical protein [Clostridiales bacterium]HCS11219.1 hypothetical protein [Clostridiales bacterium]
MENRTNVSAGMGGTLIITVFVVLCLMIFAALSFVTAYSDLKLSKKAQEITADYYYIHGKAEEKLSEISDILYDIDINEDKDSILRKLSVIDGVSVDEENSSLLYEVSGEKNQKISVTLNILKTDRFYYEIEAWNLSNIELPVYEDEIIDIWEGIE